MNRYIEISSELAISVVEKLRFTEELFENMINEL
ncbi:hypothetical protein Xszus_00594 [Xenorhabdus szentirmaii]|uniref:Uncharacterized protein n=1 Tax=Xenorhabdus szentirmaii DSM 16338 TaxID=1427518 RepID=W1IS37_9GAMM|nr:hypothetical protein Xsze_03517 [Xenorhabdus szentirmaii DSM 16338]PHM40919.1 hypothetical protein Xszus_00594 [Xenorhabdus szentirmaii]CDL81302.1 hypothetical protein XSR1_120033 [Xenorhabdus szentirmaii DSM 16338]